MNITVSAFSGCVALSANIKILIVASRVIHLVEEGSGRVTKLRCKDKTEAERWIAAFEGATNRRRQQSDAAEYVQEALLASQNSPQQPVSPPAPISVSDPSPPPTAVAADTASPVITDIFVQGKGDDVDGSDICNAGEIGSTGSSLMYRLGSGKEGKGKAAVTGLSTSTSSVAGAGAGAAEETVDFDGETKLVIERGGEEKASLVHMQLYRDREEAEKHSMERGYFRDSVGAAADAAGGAGAGAGDGGSGSAFVIELGSSGSFLVYEVEVSMVLLLLGGTGVGKR